MPKKETRYTKDKRKVLRPGEYQREDGKKGYQYKLWNPRTQRFHTCSAQTLEELREKEKVLQNEVNDGIVARPGMETLDAYYQIWASNKHIKENVLSNYKYMYTKFIQPVLGKKKLKDLRYTTIQTFYKDLVESGTLAINTLDVIDTVLHGILRTAVKDDVIRRNPADDVMNEMRASYPAPPKRQALTPEEQKRFIEVMNEEQNQTFKPALLFLLRTGLRVGELTGLTWDDVDEEEGVIHVQRTLVFYKSMDAGKCIYAINSTKTVASQRDIPLTDELKALLKQQKEQAPDCRQVVDGVTNFIFVNRFGDVQHQGTLNKALRRIIKQANTDADAVALPSFSCHHLRHTFCTAMIMSGCELTVVSNLMGHRSIQTTADIYNHVMKEQKQKAMAQVAEFMA